MQREKEDIHKLFGLDTEAGRLVYKLYNAGKKLDYTPNFDVKRTKTSPHAEHLAKQKQKSEKLRAQRQLAVSAPYKIPSPPPLNRANGDLLGRAKRNQKTIKSKTKKEFRHQQKPLYRPTKGRQEKIEHLQMVMSTANDEPEVIDEETTNTAPEEQGKKQSEAQRLFQDIVSEIEERRNFMEQMWDKGNAKQYERTIKAEIAEVFYDNI